MKKVSKILSVILSLALLAGFAAVLVTAEDQANGITATVGKVTGAKGDQVTVPVQISENSNVVSFTGSITYDSTKLKVVKHQFGGEDVFVSSEIWEGELASNESPAGTLLIAGAKNETGYTGSGNLFVVTFEVLEDLTEITPVSVDFTVFEVHADGEDKVADVTVVAGGVEPETGDSSETTTSDTTTTTEPLTGVQVKVGEVTGEVGETVTLPITISADSYMVSFTGEISYDPAQLEPVGSEDQYVTSDVFTGEVSSYVVEPGTLRVAGAKADEGITAAGNLMKVSFKVLDGFTGEAAVTLEFEVFETNEDGEDSVDTEVTVTAGAVVGTQSSDTSASVTDPGSETEPSTPPTEFPENGVRLTIDKVQGNVGDVVEVPIYEEENSYIASFTFTIKYDANALEAVKMELDDDGYTYETYAFSEVFNRPIDSLESNVVTPGQLKIAGASSREGITKAGKFIVVSFRVLEGFDASSTLELDVEAMQTSENGSENIDAVVVANTDGGVYAEVPTESTSEPPVDPDPSGSDTTPSVTGPTSGPETGDSSNVTLYLLLAGAAVVVMAGSVVALKKAQAK